MVKNTKTSKKTPKTTKKAQSSKVKAGNFSSQNNRIKRSQVLLTMALFAIVGGAWLLLSSAAAPNERALANSGRVPGQIIVKFKPGSAADKQAELLNRYQGKVKDDLPKLGLKVISVPEPAVDAVLEALSRNDLVEFAEADGLVSITATPNDTSYGSQYHHPLTKSNTAWDITKGSSNVVIAVLDTGVDFSHPDLNRKITTNGYDFINSDADATDDKGHGTFVAGVAAAATNNSTGVAGSCWDCLVMPVKVLGADGFGSWSGVSKGIIHATDNGAQIINMSLSGSGSSSSLSSAVNYAESKNVTVVASAGNQSTDVPQYPASYAPVISVAATGTTDTLASFSNFGSSVDIAAPGSGILSTTRGSGYGGGSGTSFSAPIVAGIVGLIRTVKPTATVAEIRTAINSTADSCCDGRIPGGRLNATKAVQAILGITTAPDTTAPSVNITTPTNGATVTGVVSINVNATDNTSVSKVELLRNGSLFATSTSDPAAFSMDTKTIANGTYTLTAKAYDGAGNVSTSAAVSVNVANIVDTTAPVSKVTSPVSGSTISGIANITATSTDNVGIRSTELYIDGILRASSGDGNLSFNWNTGSVNNGGHTLFVKAYDTAGNVGSSTTVTISVFNEVDISVPIVTVASPDQGTVISGPFNEVTASATDNTSVTKMDVVIDGKLMSTSDGGSLKYRWKTNKLSAGLHTITINAYDATGNKGTKTIQVAR